MNPYEAFALIALLLAIAAEWVGYLDDRERYRRRVRPERVVAVVWGRGDGRRDYPPVGPPPYPPPPPPPPKSGR